MDSVFSLKRTFESVFIARISPPGLCNVNNLAGNLNRIMSVYVLLRTVVPRLLRAKVDRHNEGLPQVITCGPHVCQDIHYYTLIMIIGP